MVRDEKIDRLAQAMGLPVYTLILFVTSKYLVFRAAPAAPGPGLR